MKQDHFNQQHLGVLAAAGAYILWGILPVCWKFIHAVPAQEILAHRIIWSFVFMIFVLVISKGWSPSGMICGRSFYNGTNYLAL
jgi:chloramphenicol-sensitive protein RarD